MSWLCRWLADGIAIIGFLSDDSQDPLVGVIGAGAADVPAQGAIEALQAAGGTQMAAVPVRVLLLDAIVGQGGAEVAAQGGDGVRLGVPVLADDLQVAA